MKNFFLPVFLTFACAQAQSSLTLKNFTGQCTVTCKSSTVVQPTPNPTPVTTPSGWMALGYTMGYERGLPEAANVAWSGLTHLSIGAVYPEANGQLNTNFYIGAEGKNWAKTLAGKALQNGVMPVLMVGGSGVSDAAWRAFIPTAHTQLLALGKELGVTGFELNWETTSGNLTESDGTMLYDLAVKLKNEKYWLHHPMQWANANYSTVPAYKSKLAGVVDKMSYMTYAMSGPYFPKVWHSSALKNHTSETPTSAEVSANLGATVIAKNKLGIGAGFFGQCIGGVKEPLEKIVFGPGLYQYLGDDNTMSYNNIVTQYLQKMQSKFDTLARVPYLTSNAPSSGTLYPCNYVTYENAQSIKEKVAWAKAQGLGGIIAWTITQDKNGELTRLLK